jgi:N utilization substance protein A
MFISDIKRVVEQVSRDKGIDREVLIKALEEALRSAARKKFGSKLDIEVQYNDESGEIEVFQFKDVAEVVTEPAYEISLEEGRKLDPDCEVGDSLGTKMDATTFGRIAAQSAKQVIIQKMKDAEKDAVYANFIDRKGEIINGIVQRVDRGDITASGPIFLTSSMKHVARKSCFLERIRIFSLIFFEPKCRRLAKESSTLWGLPVNPVCAPRSP